MFPFNFEWAWDPPHLVFFGSFWFAMSILGAGLTFCVVKAIVDTVLGRGSDH